MFQWPKQNSVSKPPPKEEVHEEEELHSKAHFIYNVTMDFLIAFIAAFEMVLIIMVAVTHFVKYTSKGSSGYIEKGFISLMPLFYNFIGVIYFLSSKRERVVIERIFPKRPYLTDIFQIPVIGPFLTTLTVFIKSWSQHSDYATYERLEASATKMRQAVTFFSSSPEAVIQLSIMISDKNHLDYFWLEIATVFVAIFAVAEANVYGIVSDYYKLFMASDEKSWKAVHAVNFRQKVYLLLHGFFSVATNLLSRTFLTNAAVFYFKGFNPNFVVLAVFIAHILIRQTIFYIANIIKYLYNRKTMPSLVYEAFNYAWRSAILSTDFQSDSKVNQIWFYLDNGFGFLIWYYLKSHTYDFGEGISINEEKFLIFSGIFALCFILSIAGLVLTRYYLKLNALQNFLFASKGLFTDALKFVNQRGTSVETLTSSVSENSDNIP